MTTNQTIDDVPRELLESAWEISVDTWSRAEELRALLDAKPVMCHGCMVEGVSSDHFDSSGKCKAAQAQGEPVGFRYRAHGGPWELMPESPFADGRTHYRENGEELEPVYAEQPAPVTNQTPNEK